MLYWLGRMHEDCLVHGEVALVPYKDTAQAVASVVATVDYDEKAIGCAWCGEWAADSGQPIQSYFKLVVLHPEWLSHDVRRLKLHPAVLYCLDCWTEHKAQFIRGFDIDAAPDHTGSESSASPSNPTDQSP